MKDANSSTRLKPGKKPEDPARTPTETGNEHRARPGSEQHRENQQELGVGADHRTDDMKRNHRGTFP